MRFYMLYTGPPRRHRIQPVEGPVLDLRAKETCFKKGSEWTPLKAKAVLPGGSSFGSFILLKRLFQVEADLTSNSCGWNLELYVIQMSIYFNP